MFVRRISTVRLAQKKQLIPAKIKGLLFWKMHSSGVNAFSFELPNLIFLPSWQQYWQLRYQNFNYQRRQSNTFSILSKSVTLFVLQIYPNEDGIHFNEGLFYGTSKSDLRRIVSLIKGSYNGLNWTLFVSRLYVLGECKYLEK